MRRTIHQKLTQLPLHHGPKQQFKNGAFGTTHTLEKVTSKCSELGFTFVRLPPCHCCFNPIEMLWSQIKRHVRKNNKIFKLDEVENLLLQAIDLVTPAQWHNYVDHVIKQENKCWDIDGLMVETIDS